MSLGYKDLFDTACYKSEYRKPTRKEHMNKIIHDSFENPLKEAILNRKVPKSNFYYIRSPQKLPPSYLTRLKDLDDDGIQLKKHEIISEKQKNWKRDHFLSIRFKEEVEAERAPLSYFKKHSDAVWKQPDIIQNGKKVHKDPKIPEESNEMVDHGIHISSLPRNVERRQSTSAEANALIIEESKLGVKSSKETYSTRNVDYMLDIWQKSEGIDLNEYFKSRQNSNVQKRIQVNQKSKELAYERNFTLENNDLFTKVLDSNIERNSHPEEQNTEMIKNETEVVTDPILLQLRSLNEELKNISERDVNQRISKLAKFNGIDDAAPKMAEFGNGTRRVLLTPPSNQNGSHLSRSTMHFLKKLSLEDGQVKNIQVDNPEDKLKLILNGPQDGEMEPLFLTERNRTFVPIRVKRRHEQISYSPGAWSKLIGSAFLPNGEIRIYDATENHLEPNQKVLQLMSNDFIDWDDENENMDRFQMYQNENSLAEAHLLFSEGDLTIQGAEPKALEENVIKPSLTQRRLSNFQRRLSIFHQKAHIEKKIYTLEELNQMSIARKAEERAKSGRKYFSLTHFCGLIKRVLKDNIESKDEPFGLPPLPPGAPPLSTLKDFLAGPYSALECLPDGDSVARISMVRIFSIALRESQCKELCYEAAQLIIQSGLISEISRWDSLLLKDVLCQMLVDGSRQHKDISCITSCEANNVSNDVIQHLLTGLGDLDENRRHLLNSWLSRLDIKHAPTVMIALIEEASNINFRVRIDVIHQLKNYIERLGNTIDHPKIIQNKKYCNDEDLDKEKDNEAIIEVESLMFQGIKVLLIYMWEDWSEQVRNEASEALGKLHQGNAIYNHLISLTKSQSPAKRLDALKCLGYLGLITKTTLEDFIECFRDTYWAIRLQACKVACKLKSNDRNIIKELLNCLNESNWQIRAYAIKAIGQSGIQAPKTKTSLSWCMMHDENPTVRAEAIIAFKNLGYAEGDTSVRDCLLTLLQTDTSEPVKKEAEKVLVETGVILPFTNVSDDSAADISNSLAGRIPANLSLPFPNILSGKSKEEVEIFLRDSLIEDKEQLDVIEQVRLLAKKEKVLEQVQYEERHSGILPKIYLDLDFDQDHIPDLKAARKGSKNTKVNKRR